MTSYTCGQKGVQARTTPAREVQMVYPPLHERQQPLHQYRNKAVSSNPT